MKDFLDIDIQIDDMVAFPMRGYRELSKGVVVGFTAQNVRIKHTVHWDGHKSLRDYLVSPKMLIIIDHGKNPTTLIR